ncbi:MAG: helix-turn-helix domain-containing protein [Candidatus Thiodiazotropha lotti]|nr:helix-turn-helix domain-containing protein [Candidatus Thiodiazotropha lotti]
MEPLLITINDAANILAISTRTVRRMLDRGDLPTVRVGRSIRIPTKALKDWVEQGTDQSEKLIQTRFISRCSTHGKKPSSGQLVAPTTASKELDDLLALKKT